MRLCVCVCTFTVQYQYSHFLLSQFLLYVIHINLDNWVLKWKGPDKSAWGTCTPHNGKNNSSSSSSSSGGDRGGRILLCLIDFGRAKDTRLESYSSLLQPCKKATSTRTSIGVDDVSERGIGTGRRIGIGRGVEVEWQEDHRRKSSVSSYRSSDNDKDKAKDRVKEMKRDGGLRETRKNCEGEVRRSRRNIMEEKIHADSKKEKGEGEVEEGNKIGKEGEEGERQGEGQEIYDAVVGHPNALTQGTLSNMNMNMNRNRNMGRNDNALSYDATVALERGTYLRALFFYFTVSLLLISSLVYLHFISLFFLSKTVINHSSNTFRTAFRCLSLLFIVDRL